MKIERAIRILDPETSAVALGEIEYYGGLRGKEKMLAACEDACRVACEVMRKYHTQADSGLLAFIQEEVPYRLNELDLDVEITDDLVAECVKKLHESSNVMFDYDKMDDFLLDIVDKYSGKGDDENDDCRSTV